MQVVDNYFLRAKKGFQLGNRSVARQTPARKIALALFPKPITAKDTL
jgi:hypothetical protein